MAINGLGSQYDLFHNFNNQNALSKLPIVGQNDTRVREGQLSLDELNKSEVKEDLVSSSKQEQDAPQEVTSTLSPMQEEKLGSRSVVSQPEDISLKYNANAEFDLIGKDSSIVELDVEKAISEMKKDSILEQYQYFVGDQKTSVVDDEDGIVFQKFSQDIF